MVDRAWGTKTYFHRGVVKAKSRSCWAKPVRGGALTSERVRLDGDSVLVLGLGDNDNSHFDKASFRGKCNTPLFGVKLQQN